MSDQNASGPARMDIRPVKQPIWRRLSLVWFVPLIALAISLWAAWENYSDRGTLITISFENATGIAAGETVIKYRDVDVGEVEDVEFSEGLTDVLVHARVDKTIAPYLDDDAQFWVVRPDVSVRGITGLETVLSGVFIEGNWDTEADVAQTEFIGLEQPNLTRAGQRGKLVVLRTTDGGSLAAGAPILHKGLEVGYLEEPQLSFDGRNVTVNAFIESPFDRRITSSTRFWDTSGFSVSLGAGGVSLNVDSLASLIEGGIAFDTVVSGGEPVNDGHRFDIFDSEEAARDSLFQDPDAEVLEVAALFEESVTGLTVGSEVRLQGIRVGEVSNLNAIVVGEGESAQVRLQVVLAIEPSRLGMEAGADAEDALALLSDLVTRGLRARLVTGNLLAGTLFVQLVTIEDALPAIVNLTSGAFPVIPTTGSQISDVAATAEDVLARINALPVEQLMDGAIDMMDSIETLAADQFARATPEALFALLDETRELVASDDVQAIPTDLRAVVADIDAIVSEVRETGVVSDIDAVVATAGQLAENVELATRNLPEISQNIETFTARANEVELAALAQSASETLEAIDTLISTEAAIALPGEANAALNSLRLLIDDISAGGAVENVNAALASANEAAQAFEEAVTGLPELSERANGLVANMQAVVNSYSERSRFNNETLATLRAIQEASDAVFRLARTIERNPNALLIGR
ncbi:MAG: MlaD family protein [Pseudomonadota bacterium]